MKILVTGANGFIGQSIVRELVATGAEIVIAIRSKSSPTLVTANTFIVGDFSSDIDWKIPLKEVDVVIHTVARAHVLKDKANDVFSEFRKINAFATIKLARQAAENGVKRFIFLSSIGVNGNESSIPFVEDDAPNPQEPYAISKYEAEKSLLTLAKESALEIVIIRPPLVFGSNAPGNFGNLVKWIARDVYLPFGAINNYRSFVALDNLVNFIIHCVDHPKAANEIFLISDGEDVSTTELLRKVANALGQKSLLLPFPVSLMKLVAKILGKGDVANRLFGSLQVDSSKAHDLLGWKPVITMDEQLKKMTEADY